MGFDIKWHHSLTHPPGMPLVTVVKEAEMLCSSSSSPPRLVCFILEGSCGITSLNIPETFLCGGVYASFGPHQVLPKLFSFSYFRLSAYRRLPALPWAGLLIHSLPCFGQIQSRDSCSDLTYPWQRMSLNVLTPVLEQLTRAAYSQGLYKTWLCSHQC